MTGSDPITKAFFLLFDSSFFTVYTGKFTKNLPIFKKKMDRKSNCLQDAPSENLPNPQVADSDSSLPVFFCFMPKRVLKRKVFLKQRIQPWPIITRSHMGYLVSDLSWLFFRKTLFLLRSISLFSEFFSVEKFKFFPPPKSCQCTPKMFLRLF